MLEACGISMLTVHGRTRDQRGKNVGLCSWEAIRQIKQALGIPVVSNGGLRTVRLPCHLTNSFSFVFICISQLFNDLIYLV